MLGHGSSERWGFLHGQSLGHPRSPGSVMKVGRGSQPAAARHRDTGWLPGAAKGDAEGTPLQGLPSLPQRLLASFSTPSISQANKISNLGSKLGR